MRNRDQHRIHPAAFGSCLDLFHKLTTGRVKRLVRAKGKALGTPFGDGIAGEEAGTKELGDHEELKTDGTATGDENVFAPSDASFLHGFVDGVDGLDKGGFFKAHVVWKGHDATFGDPRHGFYVFSKAAAIGCEPRCEAGGFVLLALGERAAFAVEAGTARSVMKTHHAIAWFELGDARTDGNDGASQFVAEDLRRLDVALENFLYVRTADA